MHRVSTHFAYKHLSCNRYTLNLPSLPVVLSCSCCAHDQVSHAPHSRPVLCTFLADSGAYHVHVLMAAASLTGRQA